MKFLGLDKNFMFGSGPINISDFFPKNICNETAINANFHFSHYKSMETKSKYNKQQQ